MDTNQFTKIILPKEVADFIKENGYRLKRESEEDYIKAPPFWFKKLEDGSYVYVDYRFFPVLYNIEKEEAVNKIKELLHVTD